MYLQENIDFYVWCYLLTVLFPKINTTFLKAQIILKPYPQRFGSESLGVIHGGICIEIFCDGLNMYFQKWLSMAVWWIILSKRKNKWWGHILRSVSANLPVGVRKRTNSQYYFYRIKCKLPSGENVAEEHGGFATPEDAAVSRSLRFAELLSQEMRVAGKTFEEVYQEFLVAECSDKIPLQEKYNTLYQARLYCLSDIVIDEISLRDLDWIANHFNMDGRTQQQKKLTYSYINSTKALLWRVFDYAYNQGYISNHILYQMPRMRNDN